MGSFASSASGVTVNSTSPLSPSNGDIWADSGNAKLYIWKNSENKWVEVQQIPVSSQLIGAHDTTIANYDTPSTATTSGNGSTPATWTTSRAARDGGAFMNSSQWYWGTTDSKDMGSITKFHRIKIYMKGDAASAISRKGRIQYSSDNSNWTTLYEGPTTNQYTGWGTFGISGVNNYEYDSGAEVDLDITARYVRVQCGSYPNILQQYSQDATTEVYLMTYDESLDSSVIFDDDTNSDYWTNAQINPYMTLDRGSSSLLNSISLHYDSTNNTETQFKIQISSDNSTWTDLRTILASKLTDGAWNFIRFTPTTGRYLRIYGNSGSSSQIGIREIKSVSTTESALTTSHSHLTISTSDTSLALDGS